ncbi:MAG: Spy/CpxP family protein refolding chaperone [Azospirillaceae bacterium]
MKRMSRIAVISGVLIAGGAGALVASDIVVAQNAGPNAGENAPLRVLPAGGFGERGGPGSGHGHWGDGDRGHGPAHWGDNDRDGRGFGPFGGGMFRSPEMMANLGIAFVETALDIDEAENPAWNDLAEAVRGAAATMTELRGEFQAEMTPPERVAFMETVLTEALADVQAINAAFGPFYENLDDGQREMVDGLFAMLRHHRGHGSFGPGPDASDGDN